jgi:hypothetical protein
MSWKVGDIILRDFELSLSLFTRTKKLILQAIKLQPCSSPITIKMVVIMEGPNSGMKNMWNK